MFCNSHSLKTLFQKMGKTIKIMDFEIVKFKRIAKCIQAEMQRHLPNLNMRKKEIFFTVYEHTIREEIINP